VLLGDCVADDVTVGVRVGETAGVAVAPGADPSRRAGASELVLVLENDEVAQPPTLPAVAATATMLTTATTTDLIDAREPLVAVATEDVLLAGDVAAERTTTAIDAMGDLLGASERRWISVSFPNAQPTAAAAQHAAHRSSHKKSGPQRGEGPPLRCDQCAWGQLVPLRPAHVGGRALGLSGLSDD
jgi:hypothetical protein